MKHSLLQEKYPVFTLELEKSETPFTGVDPIIDYFKHCIDADRSARFIAVFDHYAHTRSLPEGEIGEGILDAKNIVFCFGIALPSPQVMAVRPRSIGVVELADCYVITFMEAPMPVANAAMEKWARSVQKRQLPVDETAPAQKPRAADDGQSYQQETPSPGLSI